MEPDIKTKLAEHDAKLDAIYASVEKTRKYFLIMAWVTILAFVLPLFGLVFAVPAFLSSYTQALGGF